MKRQLLKRTVKLIQIVHHAIVLPREKENMQSDHFPQFSRGGGGGGGLEVKHFCFFSWKV